MDINTIYNENCLETMSRMPDEHVDMVLTSPPYDDMRDYEGYDFDFEAIAHELFRVLKEGGRVVWIVDHKAVDYDQTLESFRQAIYFKKVGFRFNDLMPWAKRSKNPRKMIYDKCTEYMFILSKGEPITFNPIKDVPIVKPGAKAFGKNTKRKKNGKMQSVKSSDTRNSYGRFATRSNVWNNLTAGQENVCKSSNHPARFGLGLARDHIYSWSNPGDLVYDPMMGSGTTARACIELGRNFIGSEISEKYTNEANAEIIPLLEASKRQMSLLDPAAMLSAAPSGGTA